VKIGIATSVRKAFWRQDELYPTQTSVELVLSAEQRSMLELFSPSRCTSTSCHSAKHTQDARGRGEILGYTAPR
jgi:hypothetical protein